MNYTNSDASALHSPTGQRMHQSSQPITTEVSAEDMNMVIWSLMEVLKKADVGAAEFNPDSASSYSRLLEAILRLRRAPHIDDLIPTGATDHTIYFLQIMEAGGYWRVGPGPYSVSGQINWSAGTKVWFDGTEIRHNTTTQTTFYADEVDDWGIFGSLTIVGAGLAAGSARALRRKGGNRFEVHNVVTKGVTGWGFYEEPGAAVGARGDQGNYVNCRSIDCWYGREDKPGSGAEYCLWVNYSASGCRYACVTSAGNQQFNGGNLVDNVDGLVVLGGPNNAHGKVVGMSINHNSGVNIRLVGVTNGQIFSACTCYGDSTAAGVIDIQDSQGLIFTGGILDASVACSGATGFSLFANNYCPDGAAAQIHGGSTPNRVLYRDNFSHYGPWKLNDWGRSAAHVLARRGAAPQALSNGTEVLRPDSVSVDSRGNFNSPTGQFFAPWADFYDLRHSFRITGTGLGSGYATLFKNGAPVAFAPIVPISSIIAVGNLSANVYCVAGDVLTTVVDMGTGADLQYDSVGSQLTITSAN